MTNSVKTVAIGSRPSSPAATMTTSANADWVADPPIGTPPERPRRRRCGAYCPGEASRCRRPVRSELSCGLLTNASARGTMRSRPSAYTYRATTWCNAIIAPSTEPASKVTPAVTANGPNGPRPVARTEKGIPEPGSRAASTMWSGPTATASAHAEIP